MFVNQKEQEYKNGNRLALNKRLVAERKGIFIHE